MREEHRTRITTAMGRAAPNALSLLERLFDKPIVSVNEVAEVTSCALATANRVVDALCGLGLLQETTGNNRNRVFSYAPYVAMFGDDETDSPLMA
jgi:Fic family protein